MKITPISSNRMQILLEDESILDLNDGGELGLFISVVTLTKQGAEIEVHNQTPSSLRVKVVPSK